MRRDNLATIEPSSRDEGMDAKADGSFVELYLRHQRSIYAFIVQLVRDYDESEDLLQKTGVVLWRKFDQFEPDTDFLAWARRIAKYEVLAHLKAKRRSRVCFSSKTVELLAGDLQDEPCRTDIRHAALLHCLEQLRSNDRELARRCYTRGASMGQVAAHLGRSVDGVYQSLRRIRRSLLQCIDRRLATGERT